MLAIDSVRHFARIHIYSRSAENRKQFIERMQKEVRAELVEAESGEDCVRNADVICTITASKEPVLLGRWLKPGCHINAAGTNWANKRELDEEALKRCDLICVDQLEQSKMESGDLIAALNEDQWKRVLELSSVVRNSVSRDSREQITLFKSNGIAAEDVAAAHYVLNSPSL